MSQQYEEECALLFKEATQLWLLNSHNFDRVELPVQKIFGNFTNARGC